MNARAAHLVISTTWGSIIVHARDGRVVRCDLPPVRSRVPGEMRIRASRINGNPAPRDRTALEKADAFVRALLARKRAPSVPVAIPEGTPFQRKVWTCLRGMKRGETTSYAALADAAGHPRAARAAGQACGANPVPLFIPCHRVLAAHGALGGFSGGLAWKRLLLAVERDAPVSRTGSGR